MNRIPVLALMALALAASACSGSAPTAPQAPTAPPASVPTAPVPPEPPAGSVAGSWVGDYDYVADPTDSDGFHCTGPATATFEQHEGAVSGVLNAVSPDCGFRDIRFEGRLEGTTLTGTMPGWFLDAHARGVLAGDALDITILNHYEYPSGTMRLKRKAR